MIAFGIAKEAEEKKGILSGWRWRRTDAHGQSGIYRKAESNNLVHICLNNEAHESVGGMPTGCGTKLCESRRNGWL